MRYSTISGLLFTARSWSAPTPSTIVDLMKRTQLVYHGFDDANEADVRHKLQLQSAWSNSVVLMETQLDVGFDNAIFSHYFDPADKDVVKSIFTSMYAGNPQGSPLLGSIIIRNDDYQGTCVANPNRLCYTDQTFKGGVAVSAEIHCCMKERADRLLELSGSDAVTCADLGDFVTYKMSTLSSALLHEYFHFDAFGGINLKPLDPFPLHIGDMGVTKGAFSNKQPNGYGPFLTRNLPQKLATRNADSYTWLALENYWTKTCTDKTGFSAPRQEGDVATPKLCGATAENADTAVCVIQ